MSDKESQRDEMCALESIYNKEELQISEENCHSGGQFNAHIDLLPGFKVVCRDLRQEDGCFYQELCVRFLPPLVLYFSLPDSYPSNSPPNFTLSCQWLTKDKIAKLCKKLDGIWEENKGMEILFLWTQFLKEESLKFLDITDKLDISRLHTFYLRTIEQLKHRSMLEAERLAREAADSDKAQESAVVGQINGTVVLDTIKGIPSLKDAVKTKDFLPNRGGKKKTYHRPRPEKSCLMRKVDERGTIPSDLMVNDIGIVDIDQDTNTAKPNTSESSCTYLNCELKEIVPWEKASKSVRGHHLVKRDERAILDLTPQVSVVMLLYDHNETRQMAVFNRNFYTCKVCFQDKLGAQCTRFSPCDHVFCRDCISAYLEVRIQDGSVQSIGCPEDKCTAEALPSQVKELVSAELFSKYDSVLLNATLDTMADILYCPRPSCQYPVSREPNEKMATCPACHYAFCIYCKMVYHGVEPCRFKSVEKRQLVEEYQGATLERRLELEQRYGKKQLQTLVDTTMSEVWISGNSKNCPHCNAAIEKSDGCNKMICWRCNTFFCWLCGVRLNSQCPYTHFNSANSQCYNKLFLGVPLEDDYNDDD